MRIAPLFYVVITMYLILIPLTYSYVISNYKLIFLNYSFLFAWVDPISYIAIGAWSIGNEWVFYSIFPLMLFLNNKSRRFYFIFFIFTVLLTSYISYNYLSTSMSLGEQWKIYINPLNQLYWFSGGFLIGVLLNQKIKINKKYLLILSFISTLVFLFFPTKEAEEIYLVTGYTKLILSLSIFMICISATFFGEIQAFFITSVFRFLGNISYSIYLIHPLIFFNVKGFIANNLKYDSEVVLNIILISITILVSTITYNIIERPCIALGKKIIVSTK